MNNFVKRTITGAVFVAVLGGSILISPFTMIVLLGVIIVLGVLEFYTLIQSAQISPNKGLGILTSLLLLVMTALSAFGAIPDAWYWLIVPAVSSIFIVELYRKKPSPFQNIALTIAGILYVAVPFSLLCLLGFKNHTISGYEPTLILGLFFLLWTNDTGAYLTGMTFGKHPMFPRISPKKSWEGFAGGLVLTIAIAYIISIYFTALKRVDWIAIGIIVSIFGVWGDLIESMLKRSLDVKDSGNILPGHGGILDRFDSVILSAPLVFVYLQLKIF